VFSVNIMADDGKRSIPFNVALAALKGKISLRDFNPKGLRDDDFAGRLVDLMAEFAAEHPAYLPLIAAPIRFARDASVRQNIRAQFSKAFMARNQGLTRDRALLIANVVVQLMKGLVSLYAATPLRDRTAVINEFKLVLTLYLAEVLH